MFCHMTASSCSPCSHECFFELVGKIERPYRQNYLKSKLIITARKNQILEKLQLQPKQSFIQSKLIEDIELLKKLYSNLGFNFIKVVPVSPRIIVLRRVNQYRNIVPLDH